MNKLSLEDIKENIEIAPEATNEPASAAKISILVGTRNRPKVLRRCLESIAMQHYPDLEIIVLDDASTPPVDCDALYAVFAGSLPIRFIRSEERLGPVKVRNQLMHEASGDIFCFLDDDAYFDAAEALQYLAAVFASTPQVGIVAFNIRDYRKGGVRSLTPHSRRQLRRDASLLDRPHRTSYFLGCAYAIHRAAATISGGFDERFVYGHEEIELAYRVLEAGFLILYHPDIIAHHEPLFQAGQARTDKAWRLYYLTRNRIVFAYKYLPFRFILPHVAGWLGVYGTRALCTGIPGAFARGLRDGLRNLRTIERRPIRPSTVAYLKAHYGRLWY